MINQIKQDLMIARKEKNEIEKLLLSTLYSDIMMLAKNDGNRKTNNDDCLKVIKKFIKSIEENIKIVKNEELSNLNTELEILNRYLPEQLSEKELRDIIQYQFQIANDQSNKVIGLIMNYLKKNNNGQFDMKLASKIIRELLTK